MYRIFCAALQVIAIAAHPYGGNSTISSVDAAVSGVLGAEPDDIGIELDAISRFSNATEDEISNAASTDEPVGRGALAASPMPEVVHMPEVPQYINDAFQK